MLWLKENNIITENIIEGDKTKLEKIKDKLYEKDNYLLTNVIYGRCFSSGYSKDGEKLVTYNNLETDCHRPNFYVGEEYVNLTPESLKLISKTLKVSEFQNIELDLLKMFKGDKKIIKFVDNLQLKLTPYETLKIISLCWPDFYCFISEIIKNIQLKKVAEYDVSDLDCFFEKYNDHHSKNAVEILSKVPVATNNNKVLTLARKISGNK